MAQRKKLHLETAESAEESFTWQAWGGKKRKSLSENEVMYVSIYRSGLARISILRWTKTLRIQPLYVRLQFSDWIGCVLIVSSIFSTPTIALFFSSLNVHVCMHMGGGVCTWNIWTKIFLTSKPWTAECTGASGGMENWNQWLEELDFQSCFFSQKWSQE